MSWWNKLKGTVRLREPLAQYTTFKIGGQARFFIEPKDVGDLKLSLILLRRYNISYFVMGAGSNLLIDDNGVSGAVIRLRAPCFKKMVFQGSCVDLGAGVLVASLVGACSRKGLSGVEFLTGIPGTVGGALVMNAGQGPEGLSIARLIEDVTVMKRNATVKTVSRKDISFGYRSSNLGQYIVLGCRLRFTPGDPRTITKRIKEYLSYRRSSQDYSAPSCGCIFKNPSGSSAGKLIDDCGLKGATVGGASVSRRHANFILNKNHATSRDVVRLIHLIQKEVKRTFRVDLKPEVQMWS